jgi:predicted chitinase
MKLHMTFRNIRVNTDKRMIAGAFYSVYNPNAPSIINAGQTISQAVDLAGELINDLKGVTRLISDFIAESETQPHTGTQIDSIQHIMNSKKEAILNNIQSQFGMEARQKADSAFQQINEGFECDKEQLANPQPEAAPEKTGPNEPSATAKKDCNASKQGGKATLDKLEAATQNAGNAACGCPSDLWQSIGNGDCNGILIPLKEIKEAYGRKENAALYKLDLLNGRLSVDSICIKQLYFDMSWVKEKQVTFDPAKYQITESQTNSSLGNGSKFWAIKYDNILEIKIPDSEDHAEQKIRALAKWLFGGTVNAANQEFSFQGKISIGVLEKIMPFKSYSGTQKERTALEQKTAKTRELLLPYINQYLNEFGLNCVERIHFFAQIAEETGCLSVLVETESSFESSKSTYKGRGIMQITGQRNYKKFQEFCNSRGDNVDFITHPELMEQPKYSVLSAFWVWQTCNCNAYCRDLTETSLLHISKIVNCGNINSNCAHNDEQEPCPECKPNGWTHRIEEFSRLKNTFTCN